MLDDDSTTTTTEPQVPTDPPDPSAAGPAEAAERSSEATAEPAGAPVKKTARRTTRKVGSRTTKKAVAPQDPLPEAADPAAQQAPTEPPAEPPTASATESPAERPTASASESPAEPPTGEPSGAGQDGEVTADPPPAKKATAKRAAAKKTATKKTTAKKATTSRASTRTSAGSVAVESVEPAEEPGAGAGGTPGLEGRADAPPVPDVDAGAAPAEPDTDVAAAPSPPKIAAPSVLFKAPDPVAAAPRRRRGSAAKTAVARGDSSTADVAAAPSDGAGAAGETALTDEAEALVGDETAPPLDVEPPEDRIEAGTDDADDAGDEAVDEGGDPSTSSDADDEQGGRRRRRRGGRRRRRSGGADSVDESDEGGGDADDAVDSSVDPVAPSETVAEEGAGGRGSGRSGGRRGSAQRGGGQDRTAEEQDDTEQEEAAGTRRRRRRRRSGEDGDASSDEPQNTVVRVRKPRNAEDEITSLHGSTRLEAKKQRRREGREAGRRRAPIVSEAEFLARREAVDRVMVIRQREDLTQIAVLEDKVLVEHYVARESQTSLIGNVYLGRVQNVLPSMEAAFIDIGKGRNAVLYAGEVNWDALGAGSGPRKIEQVLKSGQPILVQVSKDPIGHKGARLTSQVSLPGRFLVYVPDGTTSGISRKLPDTERSRLKSLLKQIVPDTAGVIVRTAAEGASEEELTLDVERLTARWADIESKVAKGSAPQLLYGEPDLTLKVVRDLFTEDFERLVVSGDEAWDMVDGYVKHVAPDLEERLERYAGDDVFAAYRIDEQIAKGLDRKVWLPSGGSLVIDRTEAMTVVDVNTGKFTGSGGNLEETVTKNNLEAAEEIVRQLRLRDIGGIIVVDFIDMVLESNRDLVLRRLVECLGRDRTRHQVAEVTSLGLVQMTRKRIGTGLLEAFSESCEHCAGRGVMVHHEPVELRKQEDEPRRGRRGRDRGGDSGGSGTGNGVKPVPSPKDIAAIAKHEPRPVEDQVPPAAMGAASPTPDRSAPAAVLPPGTSAGPGSSQPEPATDGRDEPVTVEPVTVEPVAVEPVTVDPVPVEPVPVEPTRAGPEQPDDAASGTTEPGEAPVTPPAPPGPRLVTSSRRRVARRPAGPPSGGSPVAVTAPLEAPVAPSSNGQRGGVPTDTAGGPAGHDGPDGGLAAGTVGESGDDAGASAEQAHVPVKKRGRKR
ncbi:MAG TPA: Rne/Rng family ribonuclease [Nocardioidaceae bacterium]|nr:Rne/Rng family ribonuclease [Nocardioidaceae bacterium]